MKSIPLRQWEAAAYAAGRLTQLRRVCKPQPEVGRYGNGEIIGKVKNQLGCGDYYVWKSKTLGTIPLTTDCIYQLHRTSPYGAPGDTLALREAWGMSYIDLCRERPHTEGGYWGSPSAPNRKQCVVYKADSAKMPDDSPNETARWCPPTTMPLWAVRWHPVITAVRLERVQEMTEGDAIKCGIRRDEHTYTNAYRKQFDRDNPRTPWDSNPWVWVYEIEGVKA